MRVGFVLLEWTFFACCNDDDACDDGAEDHDKADEDTNLVLRGAALGGPWWWSDDDDDDDGDDDDDDDDDDDNDNLVAGTQLPQPLSERDDCNDHGHDMAEYIMLMIVTCVYLKFNWTWTATGNLI